MKHSSIKSTRSTTNRSELASSVQLLELRELAAVRGGFGESRENFTQQVVANQG